MENVQKAYDALNCIHSSGCTGRVIYDEKCDLIIASWRYLSAYDSDGAKEMWKYKNRVRKRKVTIRNNINLSNFEKCVGLFAKKANQTNEWRIAVYNAVHKDNYKVADVARAICKERGTSGWDGVGNRDKEFKAISRKVSAALKGIGGEGLQLDTIDSMSPNNKERI